MDNSFEKLIGRVLDNRYKIENVVGIGGMAYVLKAWDLKNESMPVAVKILNEEFNSDENAVKRFMNESKAVSILDSPNVVKIYDVAMSENLKYIVMEFIDGITLKDYIDKVGKLGWKEACHYVRQILKALSHAHEKGIVHRDIKPQNVMLLRDGTVKVTDFGIAKMPTSEPLTMTDKAIGTVNYISPEQASGGTVDEKSDLYSVGVMLYEMLTGRLPFTADSPVAVAMMQVNETPVEPRQINSQIPVGLEQIVLKAMSKDPFDRFNSAMSMQKAIEYFVKNPSTVFSGTPANGTKKAKKNSDKNEKSMFPIILGVTTSFIVVCIISIIVLFSQIGASCTDLFSAPDKILGSSNDGENNIIKIKNYVGMIYTEELREELEEAGFKVVKKELPEDSTKEHNEIIRQDPKADTEKKDPKKGSNLTITLYVNQNLVDNHVMPKCLDISVQDAKDMIMARFGNYITEDMIVEEEFHKNDVAKGIVYECNPSPGTTIDIENPPIITLYVSKGPEPKEVVMPQIIGLTKNEAVKLLNENGIQFEDLKKVDDGPVGRIVEASKNEGETFMSDEIVQIYVSTKDEMEMFTMPDCYGDTKETAIQKICEKFRISRNEISVVEDYNENVAKGVVYNTMPAGGTMVTDFTSTRITLYVSLGALPKEIAMPDVLEYPVENAKQRLRDIGFKNISVEYMENPAEEGIVIGTNFFTGDMLYEDSLIVLYVSLGPDDEPNVPNIPDNPYNPDEQDNTGDNGNGDEPNIIGTNEENSEDDLDQLLNMAGRQDS